MCPDLVLNQDQTRPTYSMGSIHGHNMYHGRTTPTQPLES